MGTLDVSRDAGVVRLVLNNPGRKNAIGTDMWSGLSKALAEVAENVEDRVVVLEGAGEDFCAGADISAGAPAGAGHPLLRMQWINEAVLALHRVAIPTIAKVDGVAVGIGMNLALACDLVVASDRARFGQVFVRRGLSVDGGGTWILPRLVGPKKATELAFLGELIEAPKAYELGLITRLVPADELEEQTVELARGLAAGPSLALRQTKALLREGAAVPIEQALDAEARAQAINLAGPDFAEAMKAFKEKRPAAFA